MHDVLEVAVADYWKSAVKPRNFSDFCDMFDAHEGPLGLWEIKLSDRYTNEVKKRIWMKNVITDNGATAMLKNTWNNAGSAIAIFNQIALSPNAGTTTLTSALAANATGVVTLSVAALPAAIPANTTLTLGFGTSNTQTVTTGGSTTTAGSTSITVVSFTVNATGFSIGANVVPSPNVSDNPSSVSSAIYSGALSGGAFTFSGSGANNRQVVISFTFNGGSFTAGNYTEAYTTNANPIVANATASHLISTVMPLNTSTNVTATITEKV